MAIKSHYGLAHAGEEDNGKLNSRSCVGSDTKMFFACDEGAGTVVDDHSAEQFQADNATADITVAVGAADNTMAMLVFNGTTQSVPLTNGDVSTLSPLASESFIMFGAMRVVGFNVFALFVLGDQTVGAAKVSISNSTTTLHDGTNAVEVLGGFGAVDVGDDVFAALVVDRENNSFYRVSRNKTTGVYYKVESEDDLSLVGDTILIDAMQVGVSFAQDVYGLGFRKFPNGIPDTILADIEELGENLLAGKKVLPTNWLVNQ